MSKSFTLNLNSIPQEMRLVIQFLQKGKLGELGTTESITVDWDQFINYVMHHKLYPLLYKDIKLQKKYLPEFVFNAIENKYKKNTLKMLHLSGEMHRVAMEFSNNDIKTLFLKGPILAYELYNDISQRTSSDLDIIIPFNKLSHAERILSNDGYKKDEYIQSVLNDWKWRHHHFTYYHPEKKIKIEVHWRLNPGPSKEPSFKELWERKRLSTLTNIPLYFLGKEDLFLFLVTHGARHGWSRLRWLIDIKKLVDQELQWEKLVKILNKYQCTHIGGQALILSSELLGTNITHEMLPILGGNRARKLANETIFYLQQMVNLHSIPVPKAVADYHKRYLFSLMSLRQRMVFILSFLYPYYKDVETLPLPKVIHFVYFPLRPFLLIWRKMKRRNIVRG